jgi:hypothetical protein
VVKGGAQESLFDRGKQKPGTMGGKEQEKALARAPSSNPTAGRSMMRFLILSLAVSVFYRQNGLAFPFLWSRSILLCTANSPLCAVRRQQYLMVHDVGRCRLVFQTTSVFSPKFQDYPLSFASRTSIARALFPLNPPLFSLATSLSDSSYLAASKFEFHTLTTWLLTQRNEVD